MGFWLKRRTSSSPELVAEEMEAYERKLDSQRDLYHLPHMSLLRELMGNQATDLPYHHDCHFDIHRAVYQVFHSAASPDDPTPTFQAILNDDQEVWGRMRSRQGQEEAPPDLEACLQLAHNQLEVMEESINNISQAYEEFKTFGETAYTDLAQTRIHHEIRKAAADKLIDAYETFYLAHKRFYQCFLDFRSMPGKPFHWDSQWFDELAAARARNDKQELLAEADAIIESWQENPLESDEDKKSRMFRGLDYKDGPLVRAIHACNRCLERADTILEHAERYGYVGDETMQYEDRDGGRTEYEVLTIEQAMDEVQSAWNEVEKRLDTLRGMGPPA